MTDRDAVAVLRSHADVLRDVPSGVAAVWRRAITQAADAVERGGVGEIERMAQEWDRVLSTEAGIMVRALGWAQATVDDGPLASVEAGNFWRYFGVHPDT